MAVQHSLSLLFNRSNLLSSRLDTWSQATKCLQTLAKQIPTPQAKRTALMNNVRHAQAQARSGLKKRESLALKVMAESPHWSQAGWENETQVMDMYLLFKERSVSGIWDLHPKQTISEIPKLDFETSIHAYAHANSTNHQKPSKLSFVKSRAPADTSKRLLAQNKSQSLFPACCRTAYVVKNTRRSELKLKKQKFLPCESVSYPWNTRQRW